MARRKKEPQHPAVVSFQRKYGPRLDTAANRKALARGKLPEPLIEPLERAIEASGIPLEQTAQGWIVEEVFRNLRGAGIKRASEV